VHQLGDAASKTGHPLSISASNRKAADWIVEHELGEYNESHQLVLQSSAFSFETKISAAIRIEEPQDKASCSLWSLRRQLQMLGWCETAAGRQASLERRCYVAKHKSKSYYVILLERAMALQLYIVFGFVYVRE
jgi:hypothetical protein